MSEDKNEIVLNEKNYHEVSLWIEESVQVRVPLDEAVTQEDAEKLIEDLLGEEDNYDAVKEKYVSQSMFRAIELVNEADVEDAPQEFLDDIELVNED